MAEEGEEKYSSPTLTAATQYFSFIHPLSFTTVDVKILKEKRRLGSDSVRFNNDVVLLLC